MVRTKTQKGMVLVTGLIFLLIISLACAGTLHNLGVFSQSHADALLHEQKRYLFESKLNALEQELEQHLQAQTIEQLWYVASHTQLELPEQLYAQEGAFKAWQGFEYCVEFVGETSQLAFQATQAGEEPVKMRFLRLTLIQASMPQYALQSWLLVWPQGTDFRLQRVAWYEYFAEGV